MRIHLMLLPLALGATPALAQSPETVEVPKELTDPAMMEKLGAVMQALSETFLDMPIGAVEAAAEGREPTAADKRRTIRSETGMDEQQMRAKIAAARPAMEAGMKALASALPAMMKGMAAAGEELEKATANLPQPGYPKQ